ncbi:hypothetical protein COO72_06125 [Bifidobacterium callitrichos]|nr:hypothetical protein COO72_06125 [Bifidobacterium callitrichos]
MARLRRHGLIRPTLPCLGLAAVGAGVCYMGLLLDERALMAATVAIVAMIAVSFVAAIVQWFSGIPAVDRVSTPQYERLDHHGRVVGHAVGDLPDERGLYRRVNAVVRWRSPFGLFAVTKLEPDSGETMILPDDEHAVPADAARVAGKRVAGASQSEQLGSVRAYAPGDPIKLISWKHTARRGTLMTRETGRDERATLMLALNTHGADGLDAARMDRQVAALLPLLDARGTVGAGLTGRGGGSGRGGAASGGVRVVVTDGVTFHEGMSAVRRFLACVRPDDDGCALGYTACAAGVNRFVQGQSGPVMVVVCDASDSKGFEQALAATPVADRMRVQVPSSQAPERFAHTVLSGAQATPRSAQTAPSSAQAWGPAVVSALASLVVFGVTLNALSGLVAPSGAWIWFAGALLAVASIEANIPWPVILGRRPHIGSGLRLGLRPGFRLGLIRVGAYALLTALAAAVLVVVRLRDLTGDWLFSRDQRAEVRRIIRSAVSGGFDALNFQLPPLKVTVASDVFLILLVAGVAIVIRCLLALHPIAAPVMTLLAVTALAADYSIVGHIAPWWALAALAVAFPMGVWAARPRGLKVPAALVASLVVMGVTLAGTPGATRIAYNVPLSIGEGGGMFTSNTVSPMIDLKRNIATGSDTVVLSYRSYRRMYLRMTTLDEFDGDTWDYSKELALDAGLYGAGIQLGRDSSNELEVAQRRSSDPLSAYMQLLGYFGYDVAGVSQDSLERFMGYARVRVSTLRSRFLPMPGLTTDVDGLGSDWLQYQDGSVYNRSGSTSSDTEYTASGTYLDPIRSSSGFSELSVIDDTITQLNQGEMTANENLKTWLEARNALPASGLGERDGDTILIHATIGDDGVVQGANGWRLGKVSTYQADWGAGSGSGESSQSSTTPDDIAFDDTVSKQLGIGEDAIVYGFSADGRSVTIALPATDINAISSAGDSSWGGSSQYSSDGSDDKTSQWMGTRMNSLHGQGLQGLHGWSMASARSSNNSRMLDWIRQAAERSDRRAHTSRYTSLPATLPANVKAVISQAQAAGIPIKASGYDNQVRVMRWLVDYFTAADNHFIYSLDAPDGDGRSNMEVINDFLDPESGHAGYCQHYASALAVLARAMGVPTRIVLGYNAGADDDRDSDGYRTVKSRQLHAWVEAYLDGVGWVPFDVTPASEQNGTLSDESASTAQSQTQDSADAGAQSGQDQSTGSADASTDDAQSSDASDAQSDGTTDENADAAKGDAAASGKASSGGSLWERLSGWFAALPVWGRVLIGVGGGLLLLVALAFAPRALLWWRRRRCLGVVRASAGKPDDEALRDRAWKAAWEQVKREGRRRGVRWSPSDTDAVIAARIADSYARGAAGAAAGARDAADTANEPNVANVPDATGRDRTDRDTPKTVLRVAGNASATAFGGAAEAVGRLPHELRHLFRAPRHAGGR